MAANKAEIAKQLFNIILGMGMGGAARGGISLSFVPSVASGMPASAETFAAKNYPTEFAPDAFHIYDVEHHPSETANQNSLGKAYMDTIDIAGKMQTLDEHNKAITKFVRPGMNPQQLRQALNMGLEAEKHLPAFWNESKSRIPFKVSSSAVSGIRLTPDARIEVRWGSSPKWYTFKEYPDTQQASLAAQQLLQADSIGRSVMPFQRNGKPLNFKNKSAIYSDWNKANYDQAYA